jgi:hypothetical protein
MQPSDFVRQESPVPDLQPGQVLIRSVYLSLDPANRYWVRNIKPGQVMPGRALGVVVDSLSPDWTPGQWVLAMLGWQTYAIVPSEALRSVDLDPEIPLDAYLGLLGSIGPTAYFGLLDIGDPQPGETLVVSGAAGAVGSLVGQIGKLRGCRVVGVAGSDEKCAWLTHTLGFDAAINYKQTEILPALQAQCPDGIDIFFDNVGGETLDAGLALINVGGRVPLCGMISQYNVEAPIPGPYHFAQIMDQRVKIQGFLVWDYEERLDEAYQQLSTWYKSGQISYRVEIINGLDQAPHAVGRLFNGKHQGKLIVNISEPSL